MLQERHLFLELLGELVELVLGEHVLFLARAYSLALIVIEAIAFLFRYNLS